MAAEKYMGMVIPKQYGGQGASLLDALIVIEEISKHSAIVGRLVVDSNTAVPKAIMHYGTEEQKKQYLPWSVEGDKAAIAISEPNAGSAASEMETTATLDGDVYKINGQKRWISGAGVSRLYLVFARFDGQPGPEGIGGLLVESDAPGFTVERLRKIMGVKGMPEGDLSFKDCEVPRENLLVGPGDGFKKLMMAYNCQRLGAGMIALGVSQGAFDYALAFSNTRKQFGEPISSFQGLRWMLADMYIQIEAGRLLLHTAARNAGDGFPDPLESATAKKFVAETAITITNQALQIHGALGYSSDLPIERMVRDARMYAIGGGTLEILKEVISTRLVQAQKRSAVQAQKGVA
jgi:alkylation response protein AidB-like acyl-CoA dehydrogenase